MHGCRSVEHVCWVRLLPCAGKELREAGVGWRDVFVEVPIKIHNSSLAQALIADLNPAPGATAGDLDRLSLANAGYLSKTMSNLIECMDDMLAEQGKVRGSSNSSSDARSLRVLQVVAFVADVGDG
jgi:hypothetical protein